MKVLGRSTARTNKLVNFEAQANNRVVCLRSDGRHVPVVKLLTNLSNVILHQQGKKSRVVARWDACTVQATGSWGEMGDMHYLRPGS